MFTFIGPVQFSLQKNICYNSNMGRQEKNDHLFDFLNYF